LRGGVTFLRSHRAGSGAGRERPRSGPGADPAGADTLRYRLALRSGAGPFAPDPLPTRSAPARFGSARVLRLRLRSAAGGRSDTGDAGRRPRRPRPLRSARSRDAPDPPTASAPDPRPRSLPSRPRDRSALAAPERPLRGRSGSAPAPLRRDRDPAPIRADQGRSDPRPGPWWRPPSLGSQPLPTRSARSDPTRSAGIAAAPDPLALAARSLGSQPRSARPGGPSRDRLRDPLRPSAP
jgi:hypothetical protein